MNVALYELHSIDDSKLSIVTVMARYQDKWIFVRCKYYSNIERLGELPDSEIEEVALFETIPKEQSFPDVHRILFEKVEEFKRSLMLL